MQWLNSFAFDNKSRSSSGESGSKTCRGEFQYDFGSNFEEENGKKPKEMRKNPCLVTASYNSRIQIQTIEWLANRYRVN